MPTGSHLLIRTAFLVALLATCLALPIRSFAQGAPAGPLPPNPGVKPEPPQKQAIRVRVNEVTLPVTVRKHNGEMDFSLRQKDFRVFDNDVEQSIEHFDLGADSLSVVIAIETSSRIDPILPAVRQTGIVFSQTVMARSAEAAVLGFNDDVNLLAKFTKNQEDVEKAIGRLPEGTSGTRLYDAMARGVALLGERPEGRRRILLVIAEAQDNGSDTKLGEVLRQAEFANVTIYSIGLSTTAAILRSKPDLTPPTQLGPPGTFPVPTPNGMPQTPEIERQMQENIDLGALAAYLVKTGMNALGPNSLAVASKATGGLHLNTMKDRSIEKAIDEIGGELHAQYTLGYRPANGGSSGYHDIRVEVDQPDVSVRTRPSYYVPATN